MNTGASEIGAWHVDPTTPGQLRWWDGVVWTQHVAADPATAAAAEVATPQVRVAGLTSVDSAVAVAALVAPAIAVAALVAPAVAVAALVDPMRDVPAQEVRSQPASVAPRARQLLGIVLALALVISFVGWIMLRGGSTPQTAPVDAATSNAPAAAPVDPSVGAPGSAVPTAIDDATGNGVTNAQSTAAAMQQRYAAADATASEAPTSNP